MVVLVSCAAVGVAPGLLSVIGTLALGAGLALVLIAWVLRRTLLLIADRRSGSGFAPHPAGSGVEAAEGARPDTGGDTDDLRFARVLFYVGTLTIGEPLWRKGLTVSEAFFIGSFMSCAFSARRSHRVAPVPPLVLIGAGVFGLGALLSSFHAVSPAGSVVNDLHYLYVLVLWVWTGSMVLRRRDHVFMVLALWSVSLAFDGVAAITQIFGPHAFAGASTGGRAYGFTPTPNDLGGAASIALVPGMLVATRRTGTAPLMTAVRWLPVSLTATGLVLGGSISGMSGAAVGLVFWLVAPQVRPSTRIAVVGALSLVLLVLVVAGSRTTNPLERLQLATGGYATQTGSGSGLDRLAIVKTIWPHILAHPFVGTGVDVAGTAVTIVSDGSTQAYQVHGAPLAAWFEAGILGLVGFIVLVIAHVSKAWSNVRHAVGDEDQLTALALLAAFLAFVVFAMTSPFLFQQYGWFSAVLVVAWSLLPSRLGETSPEVARAGRGVLARPRPALALTRMGVPTK